MSGTGWDGEEIEGELLPAVKPGGRELAPWAPLVRIELPQKARTDEALMEHEVCRPARAPGLEADVVVPGLQAAITATGAAVGVGVLAIVWHWPAVWVAVAFGVTLAIAWLWRIRVVDALLWEVERFIGKDFKDRRMERPDRTRLRTAPVLVNAWEARQEAAQLTAEDAGQRERRAMAQFLHRCFVAGTSEGAHGVKASGPERDLYCKRRDALMALGIAAWRNPEKPKAGWRIVVSHGRAMELLRKHTL